MRATHSFTFTAIHIVDTRHLHILLHPLQSSSPDQLNLQRMTWDIFSDAFRSKLTEITKCAFELRMRHTAHGYACIQPPMQLLLLLVPMTQLRRTHLPLSLSLLQVMKHVRCATVISTTAIHPSAITTVLQTTAIRLHLTGEGANTTLAAIQRLSRHHLSHHPILRVLHVLIDDLILHRFPFLLQLSLAFLRTPFRFRAFTNPHILRNRIAHEIFAIVTLMRRPTHRVLHHCTIRLIALLIRLAIRPIRDLRIFAIVPSTPGSMQSNPTLRIDIERRTRSTHHYILARILDGR
mmetsp:Transcript_18135/g.28694  ORF Transcript_18135/g.28694 Transcript_18135/m.28694 type:complete len:293 (+) Transcript_18135:33-911(+)